MLSAPVTLVKRHYNQYFCSSSSTWCTENFGLNDRRAVSQQQLRNLRSESSQM